MDDNKNNLTNPTIKDTYMITNMPISTSNKINSIYRNQDHDDSNSMFEDIMYPVFSSTDPSPPLTTQSSPSSSIRSGTSKYQLDFMDQEYFGMDDEQYGLVMETLLKVNKQKNVRIEE